MANTLAKYLNNINNGTEKQEKQMSWYLQILIFTILETIGIFTIAILLSLLLGDFNILLGTLLSCGFFLVFKTPLKLNQFHTDFFTCSIITTFMFVSSGWIFSISNYITDVHMLKPVASIFYLLVLLQIINSDWFDVKLKEWKERW